MWALYMLQGVLVLLVLSIFFAYLVSPLIEFFHRPFTLGGRERVMPRVAAIAVVYVLLFGSVGVAASVLVPRLGSQIADIRAQSRPTTSPARAPAPKASTHSTRV